MLSPHRDESEHSRGTTLIARAGPLSGISLFRGVAAYDFATGHSCRRSLSPGDRHRRVRVTVDESGFLTEAAAIGMATYCSDRGSGEIFSAHPDARLAPGPDSLCRALRLLGSIMAVGCIVP